MKRRKSPIAFAVCLDNRGYPASPELHKNYRVLPDEEASADGDIRVVDESDEDCLYSAERFVEIEPPRTVKRSLLHPKAAERCLAADAKGARRKATLDGTRQAFGPQRNRRTTGSP